MPSSPALPRAAVRATRVALFLAALVLLLPAGQAFASVTATADANAVSQAIMADPSLLTGASWVARPSGIAPTAIATSFGTQPAADAFPSHGSTFAIMSSGNASAAPQANNSPSTTGAGSGSSRGNSYDVTVLRLNLNVPSDANCLSVDFQFLSEEYPEFVGSYNDAFIAELDTNDWTSSGVNISAPHNFAFDSTGHVVSVNASGVAGMTAADAAGTTYDGATARLSATTPISSGSHSLYLSISDNGDTSLDSAAFVDNIQIGHVDNPSQACSQGTKASPPPIVNHAPTVATPAPDASGAEGTTITTSGTFTDPDGGPLALTANNTQGTFTGNADGSWVWSWVSNDNSPLGTVTVTATDSTGLSATDSFTYQSTNVPPVVTLSPGNPTVVDEGHVAVTYAFSISDQGSADTVASTTTSCGTGGTKVAGSDTFSTSSGSFQCVFADGPASPTVTARATDDDGGLSATASQAVTVKNVAPTVQLAGSNPSTVDEGSAERTFGYTISDPGDDTVAGVSATCGDNGTKVAGSEHNTDTGGSFRCVFDDGPATSDVRAKATDSDGVTGDAASQTVTVANVAPTVTLSTDNPSTVDEGSAERTFSYSVGDPGQDTVASVDTSCGTGGEKVAGSDTNTDTGGSFRCVFANGPAGPAVTAKATDSDGDTGATATQEVTVTDPPIAAHGTTLTATEAAAFTDGKVASFTDPTSYATAAEYTASIDWGDGTAATTGTIVNTGPGAFDVAGSHTYAEESAAGYTVKVTITDADNVDNADTATSTAKVADAPVHATGRSLTTLAAYSGTVGTFTDEAGGPASDFAASIDWGDGSAATAGTISGPDAGGTLTVGGSHTYPQTGPYTVTVKVDDVGGSTDTAKTDVLVYAFATPAGGSFAIGDKESALGSAVTFWGAQWDKANPLSSGLSASSSFKGYIEPAAAKALPACGGTWASSPGNSSKPPSTVPAYMAVVVASKVAKSGSAIGGDVQRIVVVKTAPGYQDNPGHAGTGKVVGVVCG